MRKEELYSVLSKITTSVYLNVRFHSEAEKVNEHDNRIAEQTVDVLVEETGCWISTWICVTENSPVKVLVDEGYEIVFVYVYVHMEKVKERIKHRSYQALKNIYMMCKKI